MTNGNNGSGGGSDNSRMNDHSRFVVWRVGAEQRLLLGVDYQHHHHNNHNNYNNIPSVYPGAGGGSGGSGVGFDSQEEWMLPTGE